MAQALLKPHVQQFIDFTTQNLDVKVNIEQVSVSARSSFVDATIAGMQIRSEMGVIVLAIRKADGKMVFNPPSDTPHRHRRSFDCHGPGGRAAKTGAGFERGACVMKNVLTAEQMREADRRTIAAGTPGDVLMERAGTRVVEVLEREFAPLAKQRVVIFCGKGNNGGDGLVVARCEGLRIVVAAFAGGDPGGPDDKVRSAGAVDATIVVDALLGTGFKGEVRGSMPR